MNKVVIVVIETVKRTRYQVARRENFGFSAPLYVGKSEQAARDYCNERGLTVDAIGDCWNLVKYGG